jgi:hypothetical protein
MSGRPSRQLVEATASGLGPAREAAGYGGGGVVEILKKEDFGDHWQALSQTV